MKRTEKSKASSRQKSKANRRQKSRANGRQEKSIANSRLSTLTRPSMSQLQNNAEKTPQEQLEDCMTKYNEIQMDKKLHSA